MPKKKTTLIRPPLSFSWRTVFSPCSFNETSLLRWWIYECYIIKFWYEEQKHGKKWQNKNIPPFKSEGLPISFCAKSVKNFSGLELLVVHGSDSVMLQACDRIDSFPSLRLFSAQWYFFKLSCVRHTDTHFCFIETWTVKYLISSFRSVANKLEFILGDISIMCNVVSEESDLLTFLFALTTALTTFRGFFF